MQRRLLDVAVGRSAARQLLRADAQRNRMHTIPAHSRRVAADRDRRWCGCVVVGGRACVGRWRRAPVTICLFSANISSRALKRRNRIGAIASPAAAATRRTPCMRLLKLPSGFRRWRTIHAGLSATSVRVCGVTDGACCRQSRFFVVLILDKCDSRKPATSESSIAFAIGDI